MREAHRRYGKIAVAALARTRALRTRRIGVTGLGEGDAHARRRGRSYGTFKAIESAFPDATYVDASESTCRKSASGKVPKNSTMMQCSVDLIEKAVEAQTNAAQPGVPDYVRVVRGDARDVLARLGALGALQLDRRSESRPHANAAHRPAASNGATSSSRRSKRRSSAIARSNSTRSPCTTATRCSGNWPKCTAISTPSYSNSFKPGSRSAELIDKTIAPRQQRQPFAADRCPTRGVPDRARARLR